MATPIEMARGDERQTVYSESEVSSLIADGWQRLSEEQPPLTIETVLEQPLETVETVQIVPDDGAQAAE